RGPEERGADQEVDALRLGAAVAGGPRILDRQPERLRRRGRAATEPERPGEQLPRLREPRVVVVRGEDLDRALRLAPELLRADRGVDLQPQAQADHEGVRRERL